MCIFVEWTVLYVYFVIYKCWTPQQQRTPNQHTQKYWNRFDFQSNNFRFNGILIGFFFSPSFRWFFYMPLIYVCPDLSSNFIYLSFCVLRWFFFSHIKCENDRSSIVFLPLYLKKNNFRMVMGILTWSRYIVFRMRKIKSFFRLFVVWLMNKWHDA